MASDPAPPRRFARIAAFVLVGLAAAGLIALALSHEGALADSDNRLRLVYLAGVFVLVASGLAVRSMRDIRQSLRHAGIWLFIFAGLVLVHGFQGEAKALWQRLMAGLDPAGGRPTEAGIAFQPAQGGHFLIDAEVDGTTVRFLVDTGASSVVLSPDDAERLGFEVGELDYSQVFQTANGIGRGAPVRLGRIAIGPVVVEDVRASVNKAPMDSSLLGMSFLSRTGGYAVENGVLTLKP